MDKFFSDWDVAVIISVPVLIMIGYALWTLRRSERTQGAKP